MKKLHRYILSELTVYFLLCLFLLTFLLLLNRMLQLTDLVVNKGAPISTVGQLLLTVLPVLLLATLPMSVLISCILVFSRLSNDSEFVAMTASGMSFYSQLFPVAIVGAVSAVLSVALTIYGLPWSHNATEALREQLLKSRAAGLEISPQVFNDTFDGIVLYVRKVDNQSGLMHGVMISDSREPDKSQVIFADQGVLMNDPENHRLLLRLVRGTIHSTSEQPTNGAASSKGAADGAERSYQVVRFGTYDLNLDLTKAIDGSKALRVSLRALPIDELQRAIKNEPAGTNRHNQMVVEFHKRFATPLACLILALLGAPLGVQNRRSGRHGGFALSLAVLVAYYIVSTFAEGMGESGTIPPLLAAWGPNILLSLVAVWAIYKVIQRGTVDILGAFMGLATRLRLSRLFLPKTA